MEKKIIQWVMFLSLAFAFNSSFSVEAADRNLIDFDEAHRMLASPDFDGNQMSEAEADEIIEAIIEEIDKNYMHYSSDNRQAFYNMVESHIPGNMMGAVYKTMPEYFIAYVDALLDENDLQSGPEATDDTGDYSVNADLFDSIVSFYLMQPTYRAIQIDTNKQEVNFQGSVLDDSANYDYFTQELPNQKIKVYNYDGSGTREVIVSTNMVITGLNANYHYGTDQAFLFRNAQGSLSLAYPDLTGLIKETDEPVWLEYRFAGIYDGQMLMIEPSELAAGRPEFDPSREWADQLPRMDVEYNAAHIAHFAEEAPDLYNFDQHPLYRAWYDALFNTEPILNDALRVYDETFQYELLKGGYSPDEMPLINLIRIRAYDFIRRAEDPDRQDQNLRLTKMALADRLYNREKLKQDPILEEIFNQISVYGGISSQAHDLLTLEQENDLLTIGFNNSEVVASEIITYIYDLTTNELFISILGGGEELLNEPSLEGRYDIKLGDYQPEVEIRADYELNPDLVDQILRNTSNIYY